MQYSADLHILSILQNSYRITKSVEGESTVIGRSKEAIDLDLQN